MEATVPTALMQPLQTTGGSDSEFDAGRAGIRDQDGVGHDHGIGEATVSGYPAALLGQLQLRI